jgi:hypothetical protein
MFSRESPVEPLLAELKQLHAKLLAAIQALERLSRGPPPREEDLVNARLAVSRPSLARRLLWGRILAALAPAVRGREESDIRLLQEADIRLLRASVSHVALWKPADAIANWRLYAAAESDILQRIVGVVALEQHLLYPMLEELERKSRDGHRRAEPRHDSQCRKCLGPADLGN